MKEYKIEEVIEDPETGILRAVQEGDLCVRNNPGVRRAFDKLLEMYLRKPRDKIPVSDKDIKVLKQYLLNKDHTNINQNP